MAKSYRIIYSKPALEDLEEKARYITETLQSPDTAELWYFRLRAEIQDNLATFPFKYPLCPIEKWKANGIRQVMFRRDVILYSVDETEQIVYIWAVCTRGRDIGHHFDNRT